MKANLNKIKEMVNEARILRNVLGEQKKAILMCDKILRLDANNRDAMLIKAGALKELGKIDQFVLLVKEIIPKWPDHWEAYYLWSMLYFMMNEDAKGLELMHKSITLEENFNNVIIYGQMLYLSGVQEYATYIEKAKRIDKPRAENFLKNEWVWDLDEVKPTLMEKMKALVSVRNWKKIKQRD